MQQIFTQKIHFKDKNGKPFPKWEKRKLGEISSPLQYGLNTAAVEYDGISRYIRITDIDERTGEYRPCPEVSPASGADEGYRLKEGDILFARTGASVGKSYRYVNEDGTIYFAGFLVRFHLEKSNTRFVHLLLNTQAFRKWCLVMSMRSGQPGINAKEYACFPLSLPCIAEQESIVEFFTVLDERLSHIADVTERTRTFKSAMLQQLFA